MVQGEDEGCTRPPSLMKACLGEHTYTPRSEPSPMPTSAVTVAPWFQCKFCPEPEVFQLHSAALKPVT